MNLTKNQIYIIAALVVVVVAYFMFFRKKDAKKESSWAPDYTSDRDALGVAEGGWAGTESSWSPEFVSKDLALRQAWGNSDRGESGYAGIPAFVPPTPLQGDATDWLSTRGY